MLSIEVIASLGLGPRWHNLLKSLVKGQPFLIGTFISWDRSLFDK